MDNIVGSEPIRATTIKLAPAHTPQAALLEAMLAKDSTEVATLMRNAVQSDTEGVTYLTDFIQPVLGQVWSHLSAGRTSPARAAAASELLFKLLPQIIKDELTSPYTLPRARLVLGSVAGERHDVGCRLLAHLFELCGWQVEFLGADVAHARFLEAVQRNRPELVGISVNEIALLPTLKDLLALLHTAPAAGRSKIMVGGHPFSLNPALALEFGADFTARNGKEAVAKARRYLTRYPSPEQAQLTRLVL